MNIKNILRNLVIAAFSQPKNIVHVKIEQIDYHNILAGKRIVITGGSKGIGLAMAKKFVVEGARVLITGRNEEHLKETVSLLGENACYIKFDSSNIKGIDSFLSNCKNLLGGVDSLVLNAGISLHEGDFTKVTEEGFDKQFNINFKANYFLAKSYLTDKIATNEKGNLLFMSSETASKCIDIPYGLTKASINSLVGALARKVYKRGIRVNAIAPGITYTDMTTSGNNISDDYAYNNSAGRYFLPEEVAEVACFILSDVSKCISGEVINCDAGNHLKLNVPDYDISM